MFDIRLLLFVLLSRCYFLLMDSEPSHSAGGGSLRYLSLANLGDRILQSSLGMEKDREDWRTTKKSTFIDQFHSTDSTAAGV